MDALLTPPVLCLAAAGLGLLFRGRWRALGRFLAIGALVVFVALCLPLVAAVLLGTLQVHPALPVGQRDHGCGAIIILAGDANADAPEYGGAACGAMTLERVRYGARLQHETGLPVLVSGGVPRVDLPSHAALMRDALERDFGVPVRWLEPRSRDTFENARESAAILLRDGIRTAYLVTHAWHMPRAVAAFARTGLTVVAAPTGFRGAPTWDWQTFTPSAKALRESSWALHEWLGRAWYLVRG